MREPSELERKEFEYYQQLDLDSLFITIGRASHAKEGVQFSPESAGKEGKKWFEDRRSKFHRLICDEWQYCAKRKDKLITRPVVLAVAIGDLILGVVGWVPALSVSTLLIRMGLDEILWLRGRPVTDDGTSRYWRRVFIVDEGEDPLHERVHFWQHAGTTFGAFQLIAFLIQAKAMGIAFRTLAAAGRVQLPLPDDLVATLPSEHERALVARALGYQSLIGSYEIDELERPCFPEAATDGIYMGKPPEAPVLMKTPELGYRIGALAVTEIHSQAVTMLKAGEAGSGPLWETAWTYAERFAGDLPAMTLAWLCDWSLMSPNPNVRRTCPGEAHPGWRFVRGLEVLLSEAARGRPYETDYLPFGTDLAESLGWAGPKEVLEQYESFIDLANKGEANQQDAERNRSAYRMIRRFIEAGREIRIAFPDAFALPHLHEEILNAKLPPPVIRVKQRLRFASTELRREYLGYLRTVSVVLQVFSGRKSIECVYRHFGLEPSCRYLKTSGPDEECYRFPPASDHRFINCPFPQVLQAMGPHAEPGRTPASP